MPRANGSIGLIPASPNMTAKLLQRHRVILVRISRVEALRGWYFVTRQLSVVVLIDTFESRGSLRLLSVDREALRTDQ